MIRVSYPSALIMYFPRCATILLSSIVTAAAVAGDFTVLTVDRVWEEATVVEVSERELTLRDRDDQLHTIDLDRCVGLVNNRVQVERSGSAVRRASGVLALVDGQRFAGYPMPRSSQRASELVWRDLLFGDLHVPFDSVAWIQVTPDAIIPEPGDADTVRMSNADQIEGLVLRWSDPLPIESGGQEIAVGFDCIASIRLVNPERPPETGMSRVWLRNGTIMDVSQVSFVDDGGFRMDMPLVESTGVTTVQSTVVAGLLFDASRLTALSSLTPHDIEGPPTRYTIPPPEIDEREVALGLRSILWRGPLTARYKLPEGASRFIATARLDASVEVWGNCEVVIRDDDREVFRARLDESHRVAPISVELHGSELSIEIAEGRFGPIQDIVVMDQAMILGLPAGSR